MRRGEWDIENWENSPEFNGDIIYNTIFLGGDILIYGIFNLIRVHVSRFNDQFITMEKD